MKRNQRPTDSKELAEDLRQIDSRLDQLFSHATENLRRIPRANRGVLLPDRGHVRIESTKGICNHLISYSLDLKYHYLNLLEALYCIETGRLIVYLDGLPLSLAEAYHLLLLDSSDTRKYRVFQILNSRGYICLRSSKTNSGQATSDLPDFKFKTHNHPGFQRRAQLESIRKINPNQRPSDEVQNSLRQFGPQDSDFRNPVPDLELTFDVYLREKFTSTKPRKEKPGAPDFFVAVLDKASQKPPPSESCPPNDICPGSNSSSRVRIALVDEDYSVCFAEFRSLGIS